MADFQIANYETEAGGFRPIKVAKFTISEKNPNGATAGTGNYVRAGGSKKAYGTVARQISISRQIGTDTPYGQASVSVTIPILTKAAFAAINVGEVYAYNGVADFTVNGKQSEVNR